MNDEGKGTERVPRWDGVYWLVDEQVLLGGSSFNVRFQLEGTESQPPSEAKVDDFVQEVATALERQWPKILGSLHEPKWEWLAGIERLEATQNGERWDVYVNRDSESDEMLLHLTSSELDV